MSGTFVKQLSRRNFIKNTGVTGVGLWLGLSVKGFAYITSDPVSGKNFTPYILVESNNNITLYNIRPEMGQGTFQSVPAVIAEEFEVSLEQVTIRQTNGEKEFGPQQRAGGSASIRTGYSDLRKIGASAKAVFLIAASKKWNVREDECYAENGKIFHKPTNRSFTYGSLIDEASTLEIPKEPKLKHPKDFKIIGKQKHRPDVLLKTNGSAEFGIDVQVPGMLYATVERCPVIGGTLKSFDANDTLKSPGVIKVVEVERIMGIYHSVGV